MGELSPPPKLLSQVRLAVRVRHFSRRTEEAYVGWIRRFVSYHGMRHPAELGSAEVEGFLNQLAAGGGLGASTRPRRSARSSSCTGWSSGVTWWSGTCPGRSRPTGSRSYSPGRRCAGC